MNEKKQSKNGLVVVGIAGSLRRGSFTRRAVETALDGAREVGAETTLLDLAEYDLVFCHGSTDAAAYPESVGKLRQQVRAAQGIILGTPEYHGGFSGVLKNALDLMSFAEFEGKMLGLVGVSGGRMGAIDALNTLRNIGRALHSWVVPEQASIPQAAGAFDDAGNLKSESMRNRVMEVGRQVARYAFLHNSEKAMEFLRLWEAAPLNPGGGKG